MDPEWKPDDSEMNLLTKMLWRLGSIDAKLGATPQQTMSTQVEVTNFPATQTVNGNLTVSGAVSVSGQVSVAEGTVSVDNFPPFPSSFAVSNFPSFPSNFAVNNFPASFAVSNFPPFPSDFAVNNFPASFAVSNFPASFAVNNFPASFAVSNFPATQPVSGTVAVSNFPATQPVSIAGTVPVSAAALPLPVGASTEATLALLLARFTTNFGKTVNYFSVNQGAAGNTVIAAASPGNRHKVVGFMLTSASNMTVQFLSAATGITGLMDILARGNLTHPTSLLSVALQTNVNEGLSITSVGAAVKGFVAYLTEP